MRNLYILSAFVCTIHLFGQLEPQSVKSPDAATLEKYGKYGVSLSTGAVDVNIPLHQIPLNEQSLDLQLMYDTSGLKISEPAGITGVNWSLNLPGIITRHTNGLVDELILSASPPLIRGHFFDYGALNFPNIDSQQGFIDFENSLEPGDASDAQPDVFIFNAMGKTGKFFLGQDGFWKVQSDHNFKVVINESDFVLPFNYYPPPVQKSSMLPVEAQYTGRSIGKITMIDDMGTQYIFGSDSSSIEYSVSSFFNQKNNLINSSAWYLTKVIDRTDNTLFTCSYVRGKPIARFYNNINHSNKDFLYQLLNGTVISPVYLTGIYSRDEEVSLTYSNRSDLNFANEANIEYKFQKIKDNNGVTGIDPHWPDKLYFLYSNFHQNSTNQINPAAFYSWNAASELLKWQKLSKITIKTNNVIKKEIDFEYIDRSTERLFLTNINFSNSTYEQGGKYGYKIEYNSGLNTKYVFDGSLPNYLWLGKNIFDNYSALTESSDSTCYLSCNSYMNDELVKKGSLFRIIYPSGGFTYFDFEQNEFSQFIYKAGSSFLLAPSSRKKAGGLRIKKIVNFPDIASVNRETISYTYNLDDYHSSGILAIDANFIESDNKLPWFQNYNIVGNGIKLTNNGPPVQYSKVTEERVADSNQGKTEYFYTNYDTSDFHMDIPYVRLNNNLGAMNLLINYVDRSFLRGKLIEKKIYDGNKNLIEHTSFQYRSPQNFLEKFVYSYNYMGDHMLRKIYYGDYELEKEINRKYFNGKELKTERSYNRVDYPSSKSVSPVFSGSTRLSSMVDAFPDGTITKTETDYQFDCTAVSDCNQELFGLPKKIKNYKNNILLSQEDLTYVAINNNPNSLKVREIISTHNLSSLPSTNNFTRYDIYGNIIEYKKNDGIYVSVIMDAKGTKPLARIEGVQYSTLAPYLVNIQKPYIANRDEALSNIADPVSFNNVKDVELRGFISTMRKDLSNSLVSSYTYDSFNRLKTSTTPNGTVEFYVYDNLGRLKSVANEEGQTLKNNKYNYTTNNSGNYPYLLEPQFNYEISKEYIKQNCAVPLKGDVYAYTVPQGFFQSLIPGKVNSDAWNYLIQNGQPQADLNGSCVLPDGYGLTGLSTIDLQTSGINLNNNVVSGYFAFKPLSIDTQQGSFIAIVPDHMKPSADRYYTYHEVSVGKERFWSFTIQTDGYISVFMNGTPLNADESIGIHAFQYEK